MVLCLEFHASYRCRHSGVCCRGGWNLPFDRDERAAVERLQLVRGPFTDALPDGVSFARRADDGACVFLDAGGLCSVHRVAGVSALPVTCRMFPRVVLQDARAARISLSHYCPTAAALLFDGDAPCAIVEAPAALVDVGTLDGLDARDALPPLLTPDVLMDLVAFARWEDHAIALLGKDHPDLMDLTDQGGHTGHARAGIDALESVTRRVCEWRPGRGALVDWVDEAFASYPDAGSSTAGRDERAVRRWLAARLFGTWVAYQSRSLLTLVAYLRYCLDVYARELASDGNPLEAIRRADYAIVHEADARDLARMLEGDRYVVRP